MRYTLYIQDWRRNTIAMDESDTIKELRESALLFKADTSNVQAAWIVDNKQTDPRYQTVYIA